MRPVLLLIALLSISTGCSDTEKAREHFFLRGYDELEFRNHLNGPVLPFLFIEGRQLNGIQTYQILNESLVLVNKKTGTPYTGPIRTFHWYIYNIEALFEEGKVYRLRYWHPNRRLGMDMDYRRRTGTVWNRLGQTAIIWTPEETIYLNPGSQQVRQIMTDSLSTYFDENGEMRYYAMRTDSAWQSYYPDGSPRFFFPLNENGIRDGVVKRWYPNGQLRARGLYKNGEEWGIWMEYDSLGRLIQKVDMSRQ